jgi:hypothetical protein
MTARHHHYVSQCYLNGFAANPKKPKLFVVDLKELRSFSTSPVNVASERDFHRIEMDGHRPDSLENDFSRFESELGPTLRRIAAARSIQSERDRATLFSFIGLTAIKNPRFREIIRRGQEEEAKIMLDLLTETPEAWASHLQRMRRNGYDPATSKFSYEQVRNFVQRNKLRVETATSMHLHLELGVFDKILPLIFARKWLLLKAPPSSAGFITSDHPVCLMWSRPEKRGSFYGPGLGVPGTQLLFPVSLKLALIGAFDIEDEEIEADERLIAQINGTVILHGTRQIYARDSTFCYQCRHHSAPVHGDQLLADLATLPRTA